MMLVGGSVAVLLCSASFGDGAFDFLDRAVGARIAFFHIASDFPKLAYFRAMYISKRSMDVMAQVDG